MTKVYTTCNGELLLSNMSKYYQADPKNISFLQGHCETGSAVLIKRVMTFKICYVISLPSLTR